MELALRPNWAEINLDNLAHNVGEFRRLIGPRVALMAVVKADAYGHGAVEVAGAALAAGADWLGVAMVEEGIQLRQAGLKAPILVLGYIPPEQAGAVLDYDLSQALFNPELARALSGEASRRGKKARVHLKVDTGMGRVGVPPGAAAARFAREVAVLPGLEIEGVFTHFAVADEDAGFTEAQFAAFLDTLRHLEGEGIKPRYRHAANSAATIDFPHAHLDLVRIGIAMYGLHPAQVPNPRVSIKPVMSWKTRVAMAKRVNPGTSVSYGRTYVAPRETTIATLPLGYADGFRRLLSNRGRVLVRGRRVPVVGRVCMDQTMIDLGDQPVEVGEEVVIIGRQGDEEITAEEMAAELQTINYEITCLVGRRVPRVYIQGGRVTKVKGLLD